MKRNCEVKIRKGISIFTVLLLIVVSFTPWEGYMSAHAMVDGKPDCEIDSGPCSRKAWDIEAVLDISPKPVKAMEELAFTVVLKGGKDYEKLIIDLSMPGMFMGKNKIMLKKTSEGRYTGIGVIPKCQSGRRLWQATIDVPGTGKLEFRFNVAY